MEKLESRGKYHKRRVYENLERLNLYGSSACRLWIFYLVLYIFIEAPAPYLIGTRNLSAR